MEQSNLTGTKGEALAASLMPSATPAPIRNKGFDLVGLGGDLIEVKCSRYISRINGWRFRVKPAQVEACDWLLLLALSPEDALVSYWMIPGDEIRSKQIIINEFNLEDYKNYLIEVLPMENNNPQTRTEIRREKRKEYHRLWYLAHRDEVRKKSRLYRLEHPAPPKPPKEPQPIPEGRTCTKCGEYKLLSEFHDLNHGKYDRDYYCKDCRRVYWADYRSRNNDKLKQTHSDYYHANKEKITRLNRAKWQAAHPIVQRTRRTD